MIERERQRINERKSYQVREMHIKRDKKRKRTRERMERERYKKERYYKETEAKTKRWINRGE